MQLREAKFVRPFNNDGVGVGYIQAGFDDGSTDKNVQSAMIKVIHYLFEL